MISRSIAQAIGSGTRAIAAEIEICIPEVASVVSAQMAQINPQTLSDAQTLGVNPYELVLTNWGNQGAAADLNAGSVQYPPTQFPISRTAFPFQSIRPNGPPNFGFTLIPVQVTDGAQFVPSLYGIAIAPRSTVDRCILQFSEPTVAEPPGAAGGAQFGNPFSPGSAMEQVLSVKAPLVGRFPGPIVIHADSSTIFNDIYSEAGAGFSFKPFGTDPALFDPQLGRFIWQNPELRLLLYLDSHGVAPPFVRAPYHDQYKFTTAAGTDILTRVAPIGGRKFIRVSIWSYALFAPLPTALTVSISGTFSTHLPDPNAFLPPPVFGNKEIPLKTSPVLNPQNNDAVLLDVPIPDPGLAFLLVKIVSTDGITGMQVSIDAFD